MAFCKRCSKAPAWYLVKEAQYVKSSLMIEDVTQQAGLIWYVPTEPGPPTAAELAEKRNESSAYRLFPMTPDGFTMPPPDGVDAARLLEEMHRWNGTPTPPVTVSVTEGTTDA